MPASSLNTVPELSDRDLAIIMRLVYEKSGITLHSGKRALVTARLQKLLKLGGFGTFREYVTYLQADTSGDELTAMIDAIATNHTSFFREPQHFILRTRPKSRAKAIVRSSAGAPCSSGEEP